MWLQYWYFYLYNDAQFGGRFDLNEGDWQLGLDLNLAQLGLEFKGGAKITYDRDVEYSHELPPGLDYTAQHYAAFPAYVWTIGPTTGLP